MPPCPYPQTCIFSCCEWLFSGTYLNFPLLWQPSCTCLPVLPASVSTVSSIHVPAAVIKLSLFHFYQCLQVQMQRLNLLSVYRRTSQNSHFFRSVMALDSYSSLHASPLLGHMDEMDKYNEIMAILIYSYSMSGDQHASTFGSIMGLGDYCQSEVMDWIIHLYTCEEPWFLTHVAFKRLLPSLLRHTLAAFPLKGPSCLCDWPLDDTLPLWSCCCLIECTPRAISCLYPVWIASFPSHTWYFQHGLSSLMPSYPLLPAGTAWFVQPRLFITRHCCLCHYGRQADWVSSSVLVHPIHRVSSHHLAPTDSHNKSCDKESLAAYVVWAAFRPLSNPRLSILMTTMSLNWCAITGADILIADCISHDPISTVKVSLDYFVRAASQHSYPSHSPQSIKMLACEVSLRHKFPFLPSAFSILCQISCMKLPFWMFAALLGVHFGWPLMCANIAFWSYRCIPCEHSKVLSPDFPILAGDVSLGHPSPFIADSLTDSLIWGLRFANVYMGPVCEALNAFGHYILV